MIFATTREYSLSSFASSLRIILVGTSPAAEAESLDTEAEAAAASPSAAGAVAAAAAAAYHSRRICNHNFFKKIH